MGKIGDSWRRYWPMLAEFPKTELSDWVEYPSGRVLAWAKADKLDLISLLILFFHNFVGILVVAELY